MAASAKERRERYRKSHDRAGLCRKCPSATFDADRHFCLRHYVFYLLSKKGLTKGVLPPPKKTKREAFTAFVNGRYTAVRDGLLTPGTNEETLREVIEMRLRLNISWGGFRGADKMVEIVQVFDRKALRARSKSAGEAQRGTYTG